MENVTISVFRSKKYAHISHKQEAGRLEIVVKKLLDYWKHYNWFLLGVVTINYCELQRQIEQGG